MTRPDEPSEHALSDRPPPEDSADGSATSENVAPHAETAGHVTSEPSGSATDSSPNASAAAESPDTSGGAQAPSPAASPWPGPAGDRIEPGGGSLEDDDSSSSDVPSPSAATPDLADPPSQEVPPETTPARPAESSWAMPVTSIPAHGSSMPQATSQAQPPGEGEEFEGPEVSRPVTAVPDAAMPIPRPPVTRAPLGSAFGYPARFAHAPGTGFHLALPQLGTIVAGSAVGSMVAGISAVVIAVVAGCLLFAAPLVSVAASVLAVFCAGGAFLLAGLGIRQIRRGVGEFRGTGMAITGICCAGAAIAVTVFVFLALALV